MFAPHGHFPPDDFQIYLPIAISRSTDATLVHKTLFTHRTKTSPTPKFTSSPGIKMASTESPDLKIENTNAQTADNVTLSPSQQTLVGSVLDLFAGRPSLAKLQLWTDNATFEDPLAIARGRAQYQAQWYGLQTAFSEIERLSHKVTSAGNPIEMEMETRYVIKDVGKEQTISSLITIFTEGDKISRLQDKWNGKLPEGSIKDVSCSCLSVRWCANGNLSFTRLSDVRMGRRCPMSSMCPRTKRKTSNGATSAPQQRRSA